MALQKITVPVLIEGLDQKADPRTAAIGKLSVLENLYQTKENQWKWRNGVTALTRNIFGGGTISTGRRVATLGDRLLQATDTKLYEYSPTLTAWLPKGPASFVSVTPEPISGTEFSQTLCDVAVGGGYLCAAYASNAADMRVTVIDLATGNHILTDALVSSMGSVGGTGWNCRVVALNTCFMLFSADGPTNKVLAAKIAYATPSTITSPGTSVATDLNATARFDAIQQGSNDAALVVYSKTVSGGKGVIWNSGMTAGNNGTFADTPDQCLSWANWTQGDGNAYCLYVSSTGGIGLKRVTFNTTSMATSGVTALDTAAVAARNVTGYTTDGSSFVAFIEVTASPTLNSQIKRSTGGAVGIWQRSGALASKVIKNGSNYYLMAAYESSLQSKYFLLDATTAPTGGANIVATAFYGVGGGLTKSASALPGGALISSNKWAFPALKITAANGNGTAIFYSAWYLTVDFAGTGLSPYRRLGESLHMSGGVVRAYDGDSAAELGFHLSPEKPTLTPAAGGSMTLLGTYSYLQTYAFYDSRGQLHESGITAGGATQVTLTSTNQSCTVATPTLRFGDRSVFVGGASLATCLIRTWRTLNNGSTYYLWDNGNGTAKFNDPTSDTMSFTDTMSDAAISQNEKLYISGNQQSHAPLPAAKLVEAFQQRLLLAGTENPYDVWVSDEVQSGFGVTFALGNVITLESEGGPITALGEMDDKAIVFKRNSIYVLTGAGPDRKGVGQFTAQKLSTKVGATSAVVVKTSEGLIFKSAKGFYLVTRGLDLQYVGSRVEDYNALTVNDGVTVDDLNTLRFVTTEGRTLVYDWYFRDWYTFTGQAAVSCDLWKNGFVYLQSDGTVQQEIAAQYNDNTAAIIGKMTTTWMSPIQLLNAQRCDEIELVIESDSSFNLQVQIAFDWDPTVVQTAQLAVTAGTKTVLGVCPNRTRFQAIQLTITGSFSAAGQGFVFSGMNLSIAVKPGLGRLPFAQRFA